MAVTTIRGQQITDGDVGREDLNTTTAGRAVVRKIIAGSNITISSTGTDSGTGDVTINASGGGGGITTIGTIDSQAKSADGAVISGSSLFMQTADGSNPGLISTGTQTIAGAKTFSSAPTFSTMTSGRVFFAGTGGLLSQNANLFWDNTNGRLGITTSSPQAKIQILTNFSSSDLSNKYPPANDSGILLANDQTVTGDIAPSPALIFKSNSFFTIQREMRWKIWGTGESGNASNSLVFASSDSGGAYVNRLIVSSTNVAFNVLLTCSGSIYSSTVIGAQTQIRTGGETLTTYRTTNAGSNITPLFATSLATTSGTRGWCADTTNGCIFIAGNGTNRIARAAVSFNAPVNTAGSETGELTFFTQNSGAAMAERMRIFSNGNVVIGTTTDAGFKLDVNGTVRAQDDVTISDTRNIILSTGTGTKIGTATNQKIGFFNATPIVQPNNAVAINEVLSSLGLRASGGIANFTANIDISQKDIQTDVATGTKIATANDQKIGFWGQTPIIRPTAGTIGRATYVSGGGATLTDTDTFNGYTIDQIVVALQNMGLLA